MTAPLPSEIVQRLGWDGKIARVETVPAGMSGSVVSKVVFHDDASMAVKRLPSTATIDRVRQCHRVMSLARKRGCLLVPNVHALVVEGGHVYEVTQWMDGSPLAADAEVSAIMQGVHAIARFHTAVGDQQTIVKPSPGIIERVRILADSKGFLPRLSHANSIAGSFANASASVNDAANANANANANCNADVHNATNCIVNEERGFLSDQPEFASVFLSAVSLLSENWEAQRQRLSRRLLPWSNRPMNLQWVVRDIHRDHLLFDDACDSPDLPEDGSSGSKILGPRVSGLIDFDAVRVDCVWLDYARWVGSFTETRSRADELWEALAADWRTQSLSTDRHLLSNDWLDLTRTLQEVAVWISLKNWVVWVQEQRRFPCGLAVVASRMHRLTRQAADLIA
ncbi:Phosphotransferase enzyme family protein [Rubripirellula amarantea]|uniref:Phosphotransferase enzyme family protein n=1 Tax=Rubripirellula amarantea TaxID=2527999 RepID=A0A5C5WBU1_9BACT|nr:Phosphotransferase enzyme family protein [Rubripirellula amarantea]